LIIPAHNEEKYINVCLESIVKNGKELYEIVVVNNASTDKTKEIAASFSRVRVVTEPKKGANRARQRGVEESSGNIIAFIDADTKMPENWVREIIVNFQKDEKLVCLSGPYVFYDVSVLTRVSVWLYWNVFARIAYLFTGYMAVGGNLIVRREALEKIGGFDTNINFYGDDTDTAKRLYKVGKVKFNQKLIMHTSARRLKGEGFFLTTYRYVANFLSEVFTGKPITSEYKDIR
jgi:glycosyltransferase involved in cell wall biosynthesis